MHRKKALSTITFILVTAICFASENQTPKNIILMIGDGMGSAQLTAGLVKKGKLNMERMPVGGAVKTFSANSLVTDSAAGATAFATGKKANNGTLSITPDGKKAKTLFEYAKDKGIATGVAVTCNVTHATPAAFAAHVKSRNTTEAIAEQIAQSDMEVIFGGGLGWFTPIDTAEGKRKDGQNLLDIFSKNKMQIATNADEFAKLSDTRPAVALLAPDHPEPVKERKVSLANMTQKAIAILSNNKKGFVLLVEASQIDWACHKNKVDWSILETVDFDDAIGVALDFADEDKKTLVVVTADHETWRHGAARRFTGKERSK